MPTPDPRVDAYIARAAAFAQPILREIRQRVHAACPGVEEAIRWGMPAFLHRGRLLCGMAAFKAHAALNLWARDAGDGSAEAPRPELVAAADEGVRTPPDVIPAVEDLGGDAAVVSQFPSTRPGEPTVVFVVDRNADI